MQKFINTKYILSFIILMALLHLIAGCAKQEKYLTGIDNLEFFNTHSDIYIYFGRPTCIDCRNFEQYLLDILSKNNIEIYYFNTDYWRNREGTQDIYSKYGIDSVPQIISIDSEGNISRYYYDEKDGNLKDSIEHFLGLDDLKMIGYLELVEYICLVISIGNFIAIGFALKKKKQIFKTMYFINNLGIVVISNLIIWMEGWYVDENNLSGSTMSFFLNFCNIALFILNNIMIINCKKT